MASYRLISSRSVSSDSNRSSWLCSSSADRPAAWIHLLLGREQHVRGDPDRRQRCPKLVRDVGDELPLYLRQVLQLFELLLEAGGHLIERGGQRSELVGAADFHSLAQLTGRQPPGAAGREPDRDHHPPRHQPGDRSEQEHHGDADEQQGALHARDALLLGREREEVVDLVGVAERGADQQARHGLAARGDRHAGPVLQREPVVGPLLPHPGHEGLRQTRRRAVEPDGRARAVDRRTLVRQRQRHLQGVRGRPGRGQLLREQVHVLPRLRVRLAR